MYKIKFNISIDVASYVYSVESSAVCGAIFISVISGLFWPLVCGVRSSAAPPRYYSRLLPSYVTLQCGLLRIRRRMNKL